MTDEKTPHFGWGSPLPSSDEFDMTGEKTPIAKAFAGWKVPQLSLTFAGKPLDDALTPVDLAGVDPLSPLTEDQRRHLAVCSLRLWVEGDHDERPTRAQLREWAELVLDARLAASTAEKVARRERDEARAERDEAIASIPERIAEALQQHTATAGRGQATLGQQLRQARDRIAELERELGAARQELAEARRIRDQYRQAADDLFATARDLRRDAKAYRAESEARAEQVDQLMDRIEELEDDHPMPADACPHGVSPAVAKLRVALLAAAEAADELADGRGGVG